MFLKPKKFHTKSVNHYYQNLICLAKECRRILTSGDVKNQTDLAQKLGISEVHVCRILSLLKLNSDLIDAVYQFFRKIQINTLSNKQLQEIRFFEVHF